MSNDRDRDVRPFFGESEPIIQGAPFSLERGTPVVSMTPMERALLKIEAGECPDTCPGKLDDGACTFCGQTIADWRKRNRVDGPEADPEYVPTLSRLFVDEYAEANIEPEAA